MVEQKKLWYAMEYMVYHHTVTALSVGGGEELCCGRVMFKIGIGCVEEEARRELVKKTGAD